MTITTVYRVLTPHGGFEAQWDEDEEIPVAYVGDESAIAFFKSFLDLNPISARGGSLVQFAALQPGDMAFCQNAQYGIKVIEPLDDLIDDDTGDTQMPTIYDSASDADTFTLIGEGAALLNGLDENSDTFFVDLGRLREIVIALGAAAPVPEPMPYDVTQDQPALAAAGYAKVKDNPTGNEWLREVALADDMGSLLYRVFVEWGSPVQYRVTVTAALTGVRKPGSDSLGWYATPEEAVAAAQKSCDAFPFPKLVVPVADPEPTGTENEPVIEPPAPDTLSTSPLSDETMLKYIAIAADSITALRRIDVYRVLYSLAADNANGVTRAALATWIAQKRPDLAAEVTAVMAEEWPDDGWTPPAADPVVAVTDPLPEGGTVVPPIEPAPNGERADDLAFLLSVSAQSIDMMADGIAERIEATLGKYPGDADIEQAVRESVASYTDYMQKLIGGQ
jgi:hypothetical protein